MVDPHVTICLRHARPLFPLWRETKQFDRYDVTAQFKRLAPAILNGDFDGPSDGRKVTAFDAWFDARLTGVQSSSWLDQQPLFAAANFCRLLGHSLLRFVTSAPTDVAQERPWLLYQMGFEVAREGASAVKDVLVRLQKLTDAPHEGPKLTYPGLYNRLAHDYRDNPDYSEFCALLRDHMLETWPLGPGDILFGAPITCRKLHSVRTAAQEYGIDQRRLRKMLTSKGIIPEDHKDRSDAGCTFDAAEAHSFLQGLVTFMDAKAYMEFLGLNRSQFDFMVADGFLTPDIHDKMTKPRWNPRIGRALLDQLSLGAKQIHRSSPAWCSLAKSAQRLKINPGEIARAIQTGKLQHVAVHTRFNGFAA